MAMESKPKIPRVYEEFEPSTSWERNPNFDTLIVHLPDFNREQLKVQVTTANKLRISGERPLGNNKWSRVRKEFPIASNYDTNEISAKFERGALRVKHTKIITPADHQPESKAETKPPTEALDTQKSKSDSSQAAPQEVNPPSAGNNSSQLKNGQEEASQKADPSKTATRLEKQTSEKASRVGSASADVANTASMKSSEQTSQDVDPSKTTSMEKQPSKKASRVGSASDDVAKTASRKSSEKKSTEDHFAEEGKSASGEKDESKKSTEDHFAEEGKSASGEKDGIKKSTEDHFAEEGKSASGEKDESLEDAAAAICSLVMEMKQRKKIMNMIVAVLVALVAWIYARNAMDSVGNSKN